jgi:hypothetical protein
VKGLKFLLVGRVRDGYTDGEELVQFALPRLHQASVIREIVSVDAVAPGEPPFAR